MLREQAQVLRELLLGDLREGTAPCACGSSGAPTVIHPNSQRGAASAAEWQAVLSGWSPESARGQPRGGAARWCVRGRQSRRGWDRTRTLPGAGDR